MLRVAVPHEGRLAEPAERLLREAGFDQRPDHQVLSLSDRRNDVEFFYLSPRDVPAFVASGDLHFGITGSDLMRECGRPLITVAELGFGASEFRVAVPRDSGWNLHDLHGRTIATSYPKLVRSYLSGRGIGARIVRLDGEPEVSVQLGLADAVADIVPAGGAWIEHGLTFLPERIGRSEAVLLRREQRPGAAESNPAACHEFVRRLRGVIYARSHVVLEYWARPRDLDTLEAISPRIAESGPGDGSLVVIPSIVRRAVARSVMDALLENGAQAVVSSSVQAYRTT